MTFQPSRFIVTRPTATSDVLAATNYQLILAELEKRTRLTISAVGSPQ
ncbi:MAG: hypothetical protein ABI634_12925 [Acidobacteriota bacterium]